MASRFRKAFVLAAVILWIFVVCGGARSYSKLKTCFQGNQNKLFVVPELYRTAVRNVTVCTVFLDRNQSSDATGQLDTHWPQMWKNGCSYHLLLSKWHTEMANKVFVLYGQPVCNQTYATLAYSNIGRGPSECEFNHKLVNESCHVRCLDPSTICRSTSYCQDDCEPFGDSFKGKYIVNLAAPEENCVNNDNPVKEPEATISLSEVDQLPEGEEVSASAASDVMDRMTNVASSMSASSAALYVGGGASGVIVTQRDIEEVYDKYFAYEFPTSDMSIVTDVEQVTHFQRSVTVPKEAFEKAFNGSASMSFAAVVRFLNMSKDEMNSTVLGNEVLGVEMGAQIMGLAESISINFRNMAYKGIPRCHSWNGEGNRPVWTGDGCKTVTHGSNITCQCSHLTFFAILLTPLNETIPSSDLNALTIISKAGCGISMFFLAIVLFMHFLLRRGTTTDSINILIHLVSAMFLLNLAFLVNPVVAELKNLVGCKIMAGALQYFLLTTFTWFAVQAYHLCLQMYTGGNISIRFYLLRAAIVSWVIPSVPVIILFVLGKFGELVVHTDDPANDVAMCWVTDASSQYVVNVGYYALIFLFTFTVFIIILTWLCGFRTNRTKHTQVSHSGVNVMTVMGLCCTLGVTWGFAFFAYGALRIPSYYIFTVLNSFQGLFLFIYYYANTKSRKQPQDKSDVSASNTTVSVVETGLQVYQNPYANLRSDRPKQ